VAFTNAAYGANRVEIDGTGATYDGVLASGLTTAPAGLAQAFAIEDKLSDAIDNGSTGLAFVRLKSGDVFVTSSSFMSPVTTPTVQTAIDAASSGDVVYVQAGTYPGAVDVNKSVTVRLAGNVTISSLAGIATSQVDLQGFGLTVDSGISAGTTTYAGPI